jgi:cytochrome bd-type quinol oxidase subunit 2
MSDTSHGFGRVLVAVYAVFALAASARSIVQLLTKASDAPFAYSLSAVAGVIYVVATFALARGRRQLALVTISIELIGVVVTGLLSVFDDSLFPDQTVWSGFGEGYGFVPLVLPLVGLWWLRRTSRSAAGGQT